MDAIERIKKAEKENATLLDLRNCKLFSVPDEVFELTNVTSLLLDNNFLTEIPDNIWKLTKLESLFINNNNLTTLPDNIRKLTNLEGLGIRYNNFTTLPNIIGKLTKLTLLDIGYNHLTTLPENIGKLTNLTLLNISRYDLTTLPENIGKLTNLRILIIQDNHLTTLPDDIKKLTNLTRLDISYNKLTTLPENIGKLTNLTVLDIRHNHLTTLPNGIGKLTKLKEIHIEDNPLKPPLQEIATQGTIAIIYYLQELEKENKKRYEAKLLLLGDGGEGKTCVSRALRGRKFKSQDSTRGMEVVPWSFSHPDNSLDKEKDITLKIWDFEGQEIHHQTHQFFLTEEALYVLVFKCREIFRMDRAEYWLDTIRARAPKSSVFLVITECEERIPYISLDKLKDNYDDLLQDDNWFYPVGCATNKGVKELSNRLKTAAIRLPMMGQDWPDSYSEVEKTLEKIANKNNRNIPYITRNELYTIFKDKEIDASGFDNIADFMCKIGVITHFPDCPALYDFIVIKPQWLTKAISLVLEDSEVIVNQGEISHYNLRELWKNKYPGMFSYFHNCMKEFELCYDMDSRNSSLIPLRFTFLRPKIPWSVTGNYKERRITYILNIRPPMGIMSRFIVKTHHMIVKTNTMKKGVYWHTGVFLETGNDTYKSEALCEFDNENKTLMITVRAAFPQNMIEQLHGIAKAVFSFFNGLEPERYYGCTKIEDKKESFCDGQHSEERILYALSKEKVLDCAKGWHDVDPKALLYGFTSFGQLITKKELQTTLQEERDKNPVWAGRVSLVMLEEITKLTNQVNHLQEQGRMINAELKQKIDLGFRNHLKMLNELLDNREFHSAPAIVSIAPVDGTKWNPKNWFEIKYEIIPYCEYESNIHRVEKVCKPFTMPKQWWEDTAPYLVNGIKILSAGVKIACAGLPLGVDPKAFETMKNEVAFMKKLTSHLEKIRNKAPYLDIHNMENVTTVNYISHHLFNDENLIARIQLARLFEAIAPDNYKSRQWGELRRVQMCDNTYRWVCKEHAKLLK